MIFCGLVGATCGGFIIDHFKLFKEVAVVSFSLALLCLIWFVEVSGHLTWLLPRQMYTFPRCSV